MFKKISCLMVAMVAVLLMSVSAFAVTNAHGKTIDLSHVLHKLDSDNYAVNSNFKKFINALNTNDFTDILTVVAPQQGNITPIYVYFHDDSNVFVKRQGFTSDINPGMFHNFFLNKGQIFLSFYQDKLCGSSGVALSSQHILTRYSDYKLVDMAITAPLDTSSYNKCDGNCDMLDDGIYNFKFSDSLLAELGIDYKPSEPQEPTKPPIIPPSIDIDYGFVPYDPSIWVTFMAKIKGYLAVIIPVGYKILAIVIGIPLVIKIVKMFSKS